MPPLLVFEVEYRTEDSIKQSDSYGWIWASGLTSPASLKCVCRVASGNSVFPLSLVKDTRREIRARKHVWRQIRESVSAGERPSAHLLIADSADSA